MFPWEKKSQKILPFFPLSSLYEGESRGKYVFYFPLPMAINSKKKRKENSLCIFFLNYH